MFREYPEETQPDDNGDDIDEEEDAAQDSLSTPASGLQISVAVVFKQAVRNEDLP